MAGRIKTSAALASIAQRARGFRGVVVWGALTVVLLAGRGAAQVPAAGLPGPGRLTVRPREMATGIRTLRAGEWPSRDSLTDTGLDEPYDSRTGADHLIYVPPQCVGARRCPLFVFFSGGEVDAPCSVDLNRAGADRYGVILLAPHYKWGQVNRRDDLVTDPKNPFLVLALPPMADDDIRRIDAMLHEVLRDYAIDPDKIAIGGISNGGAFAAFLACTNLDIFSRVVILSPAYDFPYCGSGPHNQTTQFFVSTGVGEQIGGFGLAQRELRQGRAVKQVLLFRPHVNRVDDYTWLWSWLHQSWAEPHDTTAMFPPRVATDSMPLLTEAAMGRMMDFGGRLLARYKDETRSDVAIVQDSVPTSAVALLKEMVLPVGSQSFSVGMADMAALAARYPAMAENLRAAGLTARTEEAYRLALAGAATANQLMRLNDNERLRPLGLVSDTVAPTSILGKNAVFLHAHPAVLDDLEAAGMLAMP